MRTWLSSSLLLLCGCQQETTPTAWPKRVTLETPGVATESDGVRLEDGAIVADGGDLNLFQTMVLSLGSPTEGSVCAKGTFTTLSDVPAEIDDCPAALSGTWEKGAYLSAASVHTSEESYVIGLGLLVRDEEHTALYRLRVAGDSYDAQGVSTATFDYEPVP